ncbi:MAG: hypothetical protein WD423_12825 [Rhodothermales bacterium]
MIQKVLILSIALAFTVTCARAQEEERESIRIEAELITGTDALTGQTADSFDGQATQAPGIAPGIAPGDTGEPGTDDAGVGDDPQTGQQQAVGQQPEGGQQPAANQPQQSVNDVAAQLAGSALSGNLSLADTAMVAALNAGSRSQRQNVDALVSITVIDADGNIRTSTMRNGDLNPELLAPSAGLRTTFGADPSVGQDAAFVPQQAQTAAQQSVFAGDIMRRSAGTTYFYIQVCSCGL